MKRFRFRLEAIARLRREQEREALVEVQRVRQQLDTVQRRLQTLGEERAAWVRVYNASTNTADVTRERCLIEQYLGAMDREAAHHHSMIRRWTEELERMMELARQAMRARRQVEFLREKQWALYQTEAKRYETKVTDEINVLRRQADVERQAWMQ